MQGVSLLAIGKSDYGTWAYNLARSLRFFHPDIQIQLVFEPSAVGGIDTSVFDMLTEMSPEDARRGGRLNPSYAKLKMIDYYPLSWDKVMFLDVDTIAIAPFEHLFDEMVNHFQIHTWEKTDKQEGVFNNMLWMRMEDMRRIFGLPTELIPGTNSSYQIMELNAETEAIYRDALEAYYMFEMGYSSRDLLMHWGRKKSGAILPDELFFNAALAKREGYDQENVMLFHKPSDGDLRPLDDYVNEGKCFMGFWGDKTYNSLKAKMTYDLLVKKYTGQTRPVIDKLLKTKFVNLN